jgi:hypothetical protein
MVKRKQPELGGTFGNLRKTRLHAVFFVISFWEMNETRRRQD